MALKTDREIANLKAEDGQRQVVAVASGAGGGCVSRFAVVGALKHGFTVIVSIIRPENSHWVLTQQ